MHVQQSGLMCVQRTEYQQLKLFTKKKKKNQQNWYCVQCYNWAILNYSFILN